MIERLHACQEAGADYFIVKMPYAAYDHEQILRFNEVVIPAVA
jgi:2-methylisocitrate lyase-like PEP mutase family enzyme